MAYRRRQGLSRSSTLKEDIRRSSDQDDITTSSTAPSSPIATQAPHRTSHARLDSFLSSGAFHSSFKDRSKGSATYDYTSMRSTNEPGGFWGVLARKAKAILDDEVPQQSNATSNSSAKPETVTFSTNNQFTGIQAQHQYESSDHFKKMDGPTLRMGLDRSTSSLKKIGDTIGNALQEGRSMADKNSTQGIIQETRTTLQNRRRALNDEEKNQIQEQYRRIQSGQPQMDQETQIKASRDVAIATATKAKLLLRELKTLKEDLAVAKQRCCQLEEENKVLREVHDYPAADDDMIRVQLETLLAEKARLAHENSVYARENRYLREIVEFHQLSMHLEDMVYLDEGMGIEEVRQVDLLGPPSTETSQNPVQAPSNHQDN